jgi:hypothetical protein
MTHASISRRSLAVSLAASVAVFVLSGSPAAAQSSVEPTPQPGAPGGTRLLFGPSGRMLEPGRGYVSFDGLFLTSANVGVTPWFSVGAGAFALPLLSEGGPVPYWIVPKVRLASSGTTSVALCAVHAAGVSDGVRFGTLYIVSTTGTAEGSFTIGGALVYVMDRNDTGENYTGSAPALLIGGERRIHPRWSIVTENYLHTAGGLLSVGFRLHRQRFMADFGVVAPVVFHDGLDGFVLGPTISLGWKF